MNVRSKGDTGGRLSPALLKKMDAYWRAANYLSAGQIYLYDNPLLKRPLQLQHVKPRLLGHWGTTPGLNFIYVHLNRLIKVYSLNMIFVTGPGHGGPGLVANTYLEGTYSELYPEIAQDEQGMKKTVHAVFISRRHSQSRGARDAGLDQRRRRARLFTLARLRCGVRQSRLAGRLCRRRR
jgi:phosphoketolase